MATPPSPTMLLLDSLADALDAHAGAVSGADALTCETLAAALRDGRRYVDPDDDCDPPDTPPPSDPPEGHVIRLALHTVLNALTGSTTAGVSISVTSAKFEVVLLK